MDSDPAAVPEGADHYEVLGVSRTADLPRIRRAYQRLARRTHPDLNPHDRVSAERYRRIREAYRVLGDPERRAEYDRRGTREAPPARAARVHYGFAGFDFGGAPAKDPGAFQEIFADRARSRSGGGPADGEDDIHARVRVSFVESVEGKQIRLRTIRKESCRSCGATGRQPVRGTGIPCSACAGSARRVLRYGHMVFMRPCRPCDGKGAFFRRACPECAGRGRRPRPVRIVARLAPGVADGSTVVLSGQGHHGPHGGNPGDLHLHVSVTPHPILERRGDNLVCPLPLTLAEAALGCRIEVPTLRGSVRVRLPPGVQPGTRIRLAGRGLPSTRGDGRGDLFLEAKIHIPEIRDARSRELVRELETRYPESPRDRLREKLRGEKTR